MSPNPALNPLLMKSIEIEYNATHLEKHELAQKHNIDLEDFLSASQDWTRNEEQTDIIIDAKPTDDIIPLPTQSAISTQSEEPNQSIPSNQVEVDDMILEIETTSKALLTKAQGMLKD